MHLRGKAAVRESNHDHPVIDGVHHEHSGDIQHQHLQQVEQ